MILFGLGAVVGLNSLINLAALLKVHELKGTLTQYIKGTDSKLENHKDRISCLEGEHMEANK